MRRNFAGLVVVGVVAALLSACGAQTRHAATRPATPAAGLGTTAAGRAAGASRAIPLPGGHSMLARPGESLVAAVRTRAIEIYRRPRGGRPFATMTNPVEPGIPLVFLVKQAHGDWLEIYVPVRPDGTTGWIKSTHVNLLYNPYRVVVSLGGHRLTVVRDDRVVDRQRISVGEAATPTPRGTYFITELFRLLDPDGPFGPYAFGLSGFSDVLKSFGGGPGQLAIHGTDDPAGIGSNVSHGCIHVTNAEITRLSKELPLGTPVQIES
jgi:lipoprotein-anchoring transpeptidase ErfK/SrfK